MALYSAACRLDDGGIYGKMQTIVFEVLIWSGGALVTPRDVQPKVPTVNKCVVAVHPLHAENTKTLHVAFLSSVLFPSTEFETLKNNLALYIFPVLKFSCSNARTSLP